MQLVDTSVIVRAATTSDPNERKHLRDIIAESPDIIGHVLVEAYATLTRLPQPFRLSPHRCHAYLTSAFRSEPLTLSASGYSDVLDLVAERNIAGGAVYDCLIARTALEHNGTLMSLDHRAVSNYAIVGGHYQLI
jgi:predicted nucleic acid-binding protein